MGDRPHVRYSALPKEDNQYNQQQRRRTFGPSPSDRYEEEDRYNYDDPRFHYEPKQRIPWKSVALALFLLSFGSLLLLVSYFLFTGHMGGEKSQASGFLVIGFLMFLPGFYETRIAYYSWRGSKGYTFSRIPDY
uniref:Uncharacterized protein n=1 Tax=Picea sitchensis TaxID=3332 RepID=D5A8W5_PICSI|nr:unknown [Picea sitchensis]